MNNDRRYALKHMNHHSDWRMAQRFIVWLLFMASGVVVIPLGVVMCVAYFPGGVPVLLAWLDWAGSVHTWMLGQTSFLGEPISLSSRPGQPQGSDRVLSGDDVSDLTHPHRPFPQRLGRAREARRDLARDGGSLGAAHSDEGRRLKAEGTAP